MGTARKTKKRSRTSKRKSTSFASRAKAVRHEIEMLNAVQAYLGHLFEDSRDPEKRAMVPDWQPLVEAMVNVCESRRKLLGLD